MRRSASIGFLALAASIAPYATQSAEASRGTLEIAVKATYLYKFGPFVQWPPSAFKSPDAPVVLCVVGDNPFDSTIDRAVAGQSVGERPIKVRHLVAVERGSGCHILYAAGSPTQTVLSVLDTTRGEPILTVTDSARSNVRGVIHFVIRNDRVRFHIDGHAAAQNGITISSKLLSLALSIRPHPLGEGR